MRILFVEDTRKSGPALSHQLCGSGHVVELARAGPVDELLRAVDHVDVMIFNVGSRDHHDFNLIRDLRLGGIDVPVIILSAHDTTEDRVRGLDAGADAYLVTPFAQGELEAWLRSLARRMARSSNRYVFSRRLDEGAET